MIPPAPPRFCRRLRPRQHGEGKAVELLAPAPILPLTQCGRVLPNPTTVGSAVLLRRSADLKVGDDKIGRRERNGRAVYQGSTSTTCAFPVFPVQRPVPLDLFRFFLSAEGNAGGVFLFFFSTLWGPGLAFSFPLSQRRVFFRYFPLSCSHRYGTPDLTFPFPFSLHSKERGLPSGGRAGGCK